MKEKLKLLFITFCYVLTISLFASAIFVTIFWKDASLEYTILWQIICIGFLGSFASLITTGKELSKKSFAIRVIIQYVYIMVVILGSGLIFDWFYLNNIGMVLSMAGLVTLGFIIVCVALYKHDKQVADILNTKLDEYHKRG